MTVKTVGLDLAKDVFQVHGISENGRLSSTRRSNARSCWRSLRRCHRARLAWKPAVHRIIGVVGCASSSMM